MSACGASIHFLRPTRSGRTRKIGCATPRKLFAADENCGKLEAMAAFKTIFLLLLQGTAPTGAARSIWDTLTSNPLAGTLFGVVLVVYGLVGKGSFYNEVEAPPRDEERLTPPKPFTKLGRAAYVGFGVLLIVLGAMGKFNL